MLNNIMQTRICFFTLLILVNITPLKANEFIIKQGKTQLSMQDVDGYAITIPEDTRSGFFNSPERIEQTLLTMLTMKHVVNHAKTNNLLDFNEIDNIVNLRVENISSNNNTKKNSFMVEARQYQILKNYIGLEESYRFMQRRIRMSTQEKDVIELAKENYLINKQKYIQITETRDIDYINVFFNENNKVEKLELVNEMIDMLKNNNSIIENLNGKYKEKNHVIEYIKGIKNFQQSKKYKDFSKFVFSSNTIGVIEGTLSSEDRYMIVVINKINKQGQKPFLEVKKDIVQRLIKSNTNKKFKSLVSKLTEDEVEINPEAVASLRVRYMPEQNQVEF